MTSHDLSLREFVALLFCLIILSFSKILLANLRNEYYNRNKYYVHSGENHHAFYQILCSDLPTYNRYSTEKMVCDVSIENWIEIVQGAASGSLKC